MDWLEEKAEQFRSYLRNVSLPKSMAGYFLVALAGAICCGLFTRNLCARWLFVLLDGGVKNYYAAPETVWDMLGVKCSELGIGIKLLIMLYHNCFALCLLAASAAAGILFIRQKVYPAVYAVREAVGYLSAGDFGHEISYCSGDEMGEICRDFEELRKLFLAEKRQEWKEEEEQRKINAAFAHDMRTPLTVIKGYTEFLQKYVPQGKVSEALLLEKLATMHQHEERLLVFSETMKTVLNMEKWEVNVRWMKRTHLEEMLEGTASGMAEVVEKDVIFHWKKDLPQELLADLELMNEVFDNVLANALRYAKKRVEIWMEIECDELQIFVKDDGNGFSERALRKAVDVYYSEEEGSGTHFGIGLSICRMLCERHGGSLSAVNSLKGGAIVCPVFRVQKR